MSDETHTQPQMTTRRPQPYWVRNFWVLLLVILFLAAGLFTGLRFFGQQTELGSQKDESSSLSTRVKKKDALAAEKLDDNTFEALGVTASRLREDETLINSVFDTAFSWDSGVSYDKARAQLTSRYGLKEKDGFLTSFMPPARYNETSEGERYYYLDAVGLNSSLESVPSIEVVKVVGTKYTYAITADLMMTADANRAAEGMSAKSTTRRVLLYITIDGDKTISDLSGVPASGVTRSSN